jgi:hypothetical protein
MGVPISEVGYTSAITGRGHHEVHKGHVVTLAPPPPNSFIHTGTVVVTCRLTFASALRKPHTFSGSEWGLCVYFKNIIMKVYYTYLFEQKELPVIFIFAFLESWQLIRLVLCR